MGLSLIFRSGLPMKFWDDAFSTSVFLINRLPTKVLHFISPLEKLFGLKPDYPSLRTFGCLCYPFVRPYNKHKLQPRSASGTFIGYSLHHKGYKVLLPSGKVLVTRDILFDESVFSFLASPHSPTDLPSSSSPSLIILPSLPMPIPLVPDPIPAQVPSPPTSPPSHFSPAPSHLSSSPDSVSSISAPHSISSPSTSSSHDSNGSPPSLPKPHIIKMLII